MVGEGVDTKGVALCTSFLTDRGVQDHTSGFKRSVADLNVVVGTKFEHNLELAGLRSTTVSDVVLVDTVVGHTTDVLSAGVGWAFKRRYITAGFRAMGMPPSSPATDAPFMIFRSRRPRRTTGRLELNRQSVHVASALHPNMADGWRRLLEEESEHQWLTLSLFAVFVAVGAFAINATERFVGDSVENSGHNTKVAL